MSLRDWIDEHYEGLLAADGLDDAIVGVGIQYGNPPAVVYDVSKVIGILMDRDGMDRDEAYEFASFNIFEAGMGEHTPIFMEVPQ